MGSPRQTILEGVLRFKLLVDLYIYIYTTNAYYVCVCVILRYFYISIIVVTHKSFRAVAARAPPEKSCDKNDTVLSLHYVSYRRAKE